MHFSTWIKIVLFLIIAYFQAKCYGSVYCYTCAWLNTGGRTNEKEDNCRPGRLDASTVIVEKCPKGCYTTMMYEYDPKKMESMGLEDMKNCTDDLSTLQQNMTVFARKCSEKSFMNDHCLIKSVPGFYAEERFCRTNYCNGESGSASLSSTVLWGRMSSVLLFSLLFLPLTTFPIQLVLSTQTKTINSEL